MTLVWYCPERDEIIVQDEDGEFYDHQVLEVLDGRMILTLVFLTDPPEGLLLCLGEL